MSCVLCVVSIQPGEEILHRRATSWGVEEKTPHAGGLIIDIAIDTHALDPRQYKTLSDLHSARPRSLRLASSTCYRTRLEMPL